MSDPRVVVLSLTRDRLSYSQVCFQSLWEHAGIPFDHLVLDQGSTDGTSEWLEYGYAGPWTNFIFESENIGIPKGMNKLLDLACEGEYDVIVSADNDAEFTMPDTLRILCETALEGNAILSPRIHGLRNPPGVGEAWKIGEQMIDESHALGNICRAAPATVYSDHGWRLVEDRPVWSGDEADIVRFWNAKGGRCGYMRSLIVNHYLGTMGQVADIPQYFARREREGGPYL